MPIAASFPMESNRLPVPPNVRYETVGHRTLNGLFFLSFSFSLSLVFFYHFRYLYFIFFLFFSIGAVLFITTRFERLQKGSNVVGITAQKFARPGGCI